MVERSFDRARRKHGVAFRRCRDVAAQCLLNSEVVRGSRIAISAYQDRLQVYAAWAGRKPRFWNVELAK
jgi:hypothetical protein